MKRYLLIFALLLGAVCSWGQSSNTVSQTWTSSSSFTVPSGITSVSIVAIGGGGGHGGSDGRGVGYNYGGPKGYVSGTYSVTPGTTLGIYVGSNGADGASQVSGSGGGAGGSGYYSGGNGGNTGSSGTSGAGGGGGGASGVTNVSPACVAGGAGGGGGRCNTANSGSGGYSSTWDWGHTYGGNGECPGSLDGGGGGGGGGGLNGSYGGGLYDLNGERAANGGYRGNNSQGSSTTYDAASITISYTYYSGTASPSSQTICSGNQPGNITLSGSVGTIQWQVSPNNSSWSNIGSNSSTLSGSTMGNLTSTMYYRANVNGAISNTVTVNIYALTTTPSSASCTGTTQSTAGLSWGTSSGQGTVTYYWVVGTSTGITYPNGSISGRYGSTTGTTASATGLDPNTTYYLRVYANASCGSSGYQTSGAFMTKTVPPVASAATNIRANSFRANWATTTGATKYYLDVATNSSFTGYYVTGYENKDMGTALYADLSGLNRNTNYYYRVRAYNAGGSSTSSSPTISLTTLDLNNFLIEKSGAGSITDQTAGNPFSIRITARDSYLTTVTDFTGNVTISTNSTITAGATTAAFNAGVLASHSVTLTLAGTGKTLTATNTGSPGAGILPSTTFTVFPAALHHWTLVANGTVKAGTAFSVTATAYDVYNNLKTNYTGAHNITWTTTAISSLRNNARVMPADGNQTFTTGTATIPGFIFYNSNQSQLSPYTHPTITIIDGATGISKTTDGIPVLNEEINNFLVVAGQKQSAGTPFLVTCTARDIYWNTHVSYIGTVRFASSNDDEVHYPADYHYLIGDHGVKAFPDGVTIHTDGTYWLRVGEAADYNKSGQQEGIVVGSGSFSPAQSSLSVDYTSRIAGEHVRVTLIPRDANGNLLCSDSALIRVTLDNADTDFDGSIVEHNVFDSQTTGGAKATGTYTADVRVTSTTATNEIRGYYNGVLFTLHPEITVAPAPVNLAHTLITASPSTMTTDEHSDVTVQLKDIFNNNRITSDGIVSLSTTRGVLTGGVHDNENGTYSATLYGNYGAVGVAHITGSLAGAISGDITDTEDVTINEGFPSLYQIVVDADPHTITTNQTSLISVQLKDQFANLITTHRGSVALFSTLGALSAVNYASAGVYQATLSGWNPGFGPSIVVGTFNGGTIVDTAMVQFNEGNPDLEHITITADPTTMTTDQSSTITIQLKDQYGNNLTTDRGTVALTSTRGALSTVTANHNGTYTATLTGDNRGFGDAEITGTLTGPPVTGSIVNHVHVTITQGKPALARIDISPASPEMTTDETRLISVQLKDQFGNNLTTQRGTVELSTTVGALTAVSYTTNGIYTSTLSTTITGNAVITGTLTDVADLVSGAITDNAEVLINDGKPALATIVISALPITITTDETSTISVQLKDQWGNNLRSQRGTVSLSSTIGLVGTVSYSDHGMYTASLTGDNRGIGEATITGSLSDPADGVSGSIASHDHVTFTEGLPSKVTSTFAVSLGTITTDGSSTITVQLKDQFGNIITHERGTVSLSSTIGLVSSVSYAGSGTYTATLTGDTRGTNGTGEATITGSISGEVNGAFNTHTHVIITEGLPSLATTIITADPTTMTTDEHSHISVQLKDALGNLITHNRTTVILETNLGVLTGGVSYVDLGVYAATLYGNNSGTGLATIHGRFSGPVAGPTVEYISDIAEVTITEGLPNLAQSAMTSDVSSITTDEHSHITMQLKDQFGNNLTTARGTVTMSTTLGVLSSVTDNENGTYSAILSGNSSGVGSATVTGYLTGTPSGDFTSHLHIAITEGLPSLAQSTITAAPTTMTTDQTSTITVRLKDQWGNNIINSRGTVSLNTNLGVLTSVTNNNNGTYTATLSANNTGTGVATITGSFAGTGSASEVNGSFINHDHVTITEGLPVLANIQVTASPTSITADETSTITVQLEDQFGNHLINSRGTVTLFTSPIGTLTSVTDNNNGTYTATFSLTAFGTGTATITGHFEGIGTASGVHGNVTDNATVEVSHGVATHLTILTQPSATAIAGVGFTQQPVVRIEDQFHNLVTSDDATVVTAARSTGTDVLRGTLTATAVDGVATFGVDPSVDLFYTKAETITLGFSSSPALATTISTNIVVSPAPTDHFHLDSPADITAGGARAAYTVTREDEFNNLVVAGSQTVYIFSNSTGANKKFYNASSSGSIITFVTIANTTSSANFWYYDEKTSFFGTTGTEQNGEWIITASDVTPADGATGIHDATDNIKVGPAAHAMNPNSFEITTTNSTYIYGDWQTVTVKALDIFGNVKTNYPGAVTFSISPADPSSKPANYQYLPEEYGSHTFTKTGSANSLLFYSATTYWVTVIDLSNTLKYTGKFFTVDPRPITITADDQTKTYGETLALGTSRFSETGSMAGSEAVTSVTLASSGAVNTADVGIYNITPSGATGTGGFLASNYAITYVHGHLEVYHKDVDVNAVTTTKTYDGFTTSAGNPTVGTLATGDVVNNAPTQTYDTKMAGSGKTLTPAGLTIKNGVGTDKTDNYTIHYYTNSTGVINTKHVDVTAVTSTKTYDGYATSSVSPTIGPIAITDFVYNAPSQTFDSKMVGTSKVLTPAGMTIRDGVSVDMTSNYDIHYVTNGTGVINQLHLDVTAQTDTKIYDGGTASDSNPIVGALVGTDVVDDDPIQTYNNKMVGTGKTLTPSGLSIIDSDEADMTGNYYIHYVTNGTGIISQLHVDVTAVTDTKEYDGNATSDGIPSVGSLAFGDEVDAIPTQTFNNANIGTGKTLTPAGLTVKDGASANMTGNYDIHYVTNNTGEITRKHLDVYAVTDTKFYDGGTTSDGVPSVGSLATGDHVDQAATQVYADKNAGTNKTMIPSGLIIKNGAGTDVSSNYDIHYNYYYNGVIDPLHLDVTAVANTKTYNGNNLSSGSPTVGSLVGTDVVNNPPSQTFDTKMVGTLKVLTPAGLTIKDGLSADMTANYDIHYVTVATGTINQLHVDVTAQTDTKIYDGNTSSDSNPIVGSLAVTDDVDFVPTQTYNTKMVGTGKTLTPAGLTVEDGDGFDMTANYDIHYVTNVTGIITQLHVDVTAATDTKIYDGNTTSDGVPDVGLLASGDVVNAAPTQTYDTKMVGIEKTLTPAGLTIKDALSVNMTTNYDIHYITNNTGVISVLHVDVTAAADTKIYDANTSSDGAPTVGTLAVTDAVNVLPHQTYDNKMVGIEKTLTPSGLTIKASLGGADMTGNYDIHYITDVSGVITHLDVDVTAATDTKVYDGNTTSDGVPTIGTLAAGDVKNDSPTQTYDTKMVGIEKVLTPAGLTIKDGLSADMTANYDIHYLTDITGVITHLDVDVTAATDTKTYDANTSSDGVPSVGTLALGDVVNAAPTQTYDTKMVGTGKTLTPAGLTVKDALSANMTSNYDIHYITDVTGVINQLHVDVTAATDSKIYDGNTTSDGIPTVGTLAAGDVKNDSPTQTYDTKMVGIDKTLTPAGLTIKDALNVNMTGNYDIHYITNTTGVISVLHVDVTAATDSKIYDANTTSDGVPTVGTLAVTDAVNVLPHQTYDNKMVGTGKTLTPSGLTIKASLGGADMTANYDIHYITDVSGVITQRDVNVTAATDTKTYDGNTTSVGVPSVSVLASGDLVDHAPTQTYNNKMAGSGKTMTAAGLTIKDGFDADMTANYDIHYFTDVTGVINTLHVDVTALTDTKTYDGNTSSDSNPSVGTLAVGDVVNDAPTQTYDTKMVGTGKTLTPSGLTVKDGLDVNMTANYDIHYLTNGTGVINQLHVDVNAVSASKTYDANVNSSASPLVGTLAPGDVVSVAPVQTYDTKMVGTGKTLTPAGLTVKDGASANMTGNYDIHYITIETGVINQLHVDVTAATDTKTYDANTTSDGVPSVGTLALGDVVNTAPGQTYDTKMAGTNKVMTPAGLTVKDGDGINMTANYYIHYITDVTGVINQLHVDVTALPDSKTYDGNISSDSNPSVGLLATGDVVDAAPTQVYDNKMVGTGKIMTASGLTVKDGLSDNMTANYDIHYITNNTGIISQLHLDVTAETDTKIYDGNNSSDGTPSVGYLVPGDAVHDAPTQTFNDRTANINKVLTPAGITIHDALNADMTGNYFVHYVTVGNGIIYKLDITGNFTVDATKVYDGGTSANVLTRTLNGIINPDVVSLTGGVANYSDKNVGNGKTVTLTGYSTSGADKDNYNLTQVYTTTADITPKLLTLRNFGANSKIYDGTKAGTGIGFQDDRIEGDILSFTWTTEFEDKNVGTNKHVNYTDIAISGGDDRYNYYLAVTTGQAHADITPRDLAITADDVNKIYGDILTGGTGFTAFTSVGLQNGETIGSVSIAYGTGAAATAVVNTYTDQVTASSATGGTFSISNYTPSYVKGDIIVGPKALTITANNQAKTYGTAFSFVGTEFGVSGLVNSDEVTSVTLNSDGAAATATVAGSPYSIIPSVAVGSGLGNYTIGYTNGVFSVSAKTLTIAATNQAKDYGTTFTFDMISPSADFTVTGLVNSDAVASVTITSNGAPATATVAGSPYSIVPGAATGTGLGNYSISYTNGVFTVNKVPMTVIANDGEKNYGSLMTYLGNEFTTSGTFYNGDVITGVSLSSDGDPVTAIVDTYDIEPVSATGTGVSNYQITYTNGTLTVNKVNVTVIANNGSKTYGNLKTYAGTEFTTTGTFYNGDVISSVSLSSTGDPVTALVNTYDIVPSAAAGTGIGNYNIGYTNGTLTVGRADITVVANNASKSYGSLKTYAGTEFTVTGTLYNGDAVNSATLSSTGDPVTALVNTYSIGVSAASGTGLSNYNIGYTSGTLTVEKVNVTVIASNASKTYGSVKTYAGTEFTTSGTFYNGDHVTSVSLSSDGDPAIAAATTYAIVPTSASGTGLSNYTIGYTNGTLTVDPKVLSITADNKAKCFDSSVFPYANYTASYSGFVNGEGPTALSGTLAFTGTAIAATAVGNYAIIPGGLTSGNYAISYFSGNLEIYPLPTPVITGAATVFVNAVENYSTPFEADHSFAWVATGGTIQGASNASVVTVLWSGTPGSGTLSVTDLNTTTGCSAVSATFNVTITEPVFPDYKISGLYTYYNLGDPNIPLDSVIVSLKQGPTTIATTTTNATGYYEFPDVTDGTYEITAVMHPSKKYGGVNATDAGLVNYWWTHRTPIEKVQWNAGNFYATDNFMNATDAGQIRGYFVNGVPTPAQGYWTFWKRQDLSSLNPPTSLNTFTVAGADVTRNFYSLCVADFNRSFVPYHVDGAKSFYGTPSVELTYDETVLAGADSDVLLPIRVTSSMNLGAISLILQFPADLVSVEDVYLQSGTPSSAAPLEFSVNGNELRIGWNDLLPVNFTASEALVTLKLHTSAIFTKGQSIMFTMAADPLNELANSQFEPIANVVLLTTAIDASTTGIGDEKPGYGISMAAYPNPFSNAVYISYTLPHDGQVTIEIVNMYGSRVATLVDGIMSAGTYLERLDGVDVNPGVYTVTLRTRDNNDLVLRTIKIIRSQ